MSTNFSDTTTLHNLRPKINGNPVIQASCHPMCYTVMVHLKDNAATPYVVATWFPGMGDEWCWGHYESSLDAARRSFTLAQERNDARRA